MVRNYKRKNTRDTHYTVDDMAKAVADVRQGQLLRVVSERYGIPISTLHNRINGKFPTPSRSGRTPALPEEDELVVALNVASRETFTRMDVRQFVKEFLDSSNRTIPIFVNNLPGPDWVNSFLKRHYEVIYKKKRPILPRVGALGGASCSKDEASHFQEENIPNVKVEVMDGLEEDNNPLTEETFSSSTFDVSEQVTGSNQEDSYTSHEKDLEEQIFTPSQYTSLGNEQVFDPSVHSVNGKKETEFDLFGKSIGVQLNNMVLNDALQLQLQIQQLITKFRLKNSRATLSSSRSSQGATGRSRVTEGASLEDLEIKTEYVTDSFVSD